jgi:hypothetical protein
MIIMRLFKVLVKKRAFIGILVLLAFRCHRFFRRPFRRAIASAMLSHPKGAEYSIELNHIVTSKRTPESR